MQRYFLIDAKSQHLIQLLSQDCQCWEEEFSQYLVVKISTDSVQVR